MALLARLKTWITGETLTASDLNAEFNNIVNNFEPSKINDYSSTTGEMDTTFDPYAGDVQTQPTSTAEEIGALRHVIAEMHGGAKWYISEQVYSSLQTETATTSGTSHDYTGIPSWVKKITIMFAQVSTNGTSRGIIQIGDSGGIEPAGYNGSVSNMAAAVASTSYSDGFLITQTGAAATVLRGTITLTLQDSANNNWTASGVIGKGNVAATIVTAGDKALTGPLTQLRLTTQNGTDAFDGGAFSIMWE